MKMCKECGTRYEQYANYCNSCDLPLLENKKEVSVSTKNADRIAITAPKYRVMKVHQALGLIQIPVIATFAYDLFVFKPPTIHGTAVIVVLSIFPIVHFSTVQGIKKGKRWSETISMIIGFMALLGFPIGTILGGYMLANLFSKDWED